MANPNSHIILKQVLELVLPKHQNAFQFQQEIGELSKKKLEPALENLFDNFSTPDELLQIDLLEVDIGKQRWLPSGETFVEAVVKAIEEQLKTKISIGNREITRKSLDLAIFEEWVYFLENGSFPPGTRKANLKYYQSSISRILEKDPSCRKELIKLLGNQPRCAERLVRQHPEGFLVKLLAALTEAKKSQIVAYKREILRLMNTATSSSQISHQQSNFQSLWKWIFENLETNSVNRLDEKEIIVRYLDHWIHIPKPKFKDGESSLRLTLRKILQESPGSYPLLVALKKQLENTIFSEEKDSQKEKPVSELDITDHSASEDSRTTGDKDDMVSPIQIEEEDCSKKEGSKPTQEPEKLKPEDSTNDITHQNEQDYQKQQVTQRENREKMLKKSQEDSEAKGNNGLSKKSQTDESILYHELPDEKSVIGPKKKEIAKKELPLGRKTSEQPEGSFWYINNAGVVLLHTFLPAFFDKCGLTHKKQFIDEAARERAAQLLFYLATGQEETPEYDMVLAKFLCGIPFEMPIYGSIELSETEKSESIKLVQSAIDHWGKLKKTSPDGLREGFLQREGKLEKREHGWYLTVEQRSMDILLNYLPWNLRMVKLPWMEELLRVEWE